MADCENNASKAHPVVAMAARDNADEEEEWSIQLPEILREESRFTASLFGYRQAMNLRFVTQFDELIKNFEMLEIYCDAPTENWTDFENCTTDVSLQEAMHFPRSIADRTPMDLVNPRQFTLQGLKLMWCRLVSHYFEWVAGIPEIRTLPEIDKLRLVTRQLCKVICFSVSWRTLQSGLTDGICFGAGFVYSPEDNTDAGIRKYGSNLADVIQKLVVSKLRQLQMTKEEYILVKLAIMFSHTTDIALSPLGREIVSSALNKYTSALIDLVSAANPLLSKIQVLTRISGMLSIVPHIETCSEVDDRHLMEMTLNNDGNIQGKLTNQIHVHSSV